ncbi:hypothetical protein Kisp02_67750 [Kineosporia sp. NBRC 101731]|nr:hypothetical protein Kisp02_67750 [Kineosporia sp. NBRC 101731]
MVLVTAVAGVAAGAAFTHHSATAQQAAFTGTEGSVGPASKALPSGPLSSSDATAQNSQQDERVSALTLVAGKSLRNGVSVGYPRTLEGAVSAGTEYATQLGSLDPDRKAIVGEIVSDPDWSDAAEFFAEGGQASRRDLGLPPTGPLPSGSSLQVTPQQFQVRDASVPGEVTLLYLCYLVITTQQRGTTSNVIVMPLTLGWQQGDWKIKHVVEEPPSSLRPLLATPYSSRATSLGWREMRQ